MSFLMGKYQTIENVPGDIKGLREGFANFLNSQGMGTLEGGASTDYMTNVLGPIRLLFEQNRTKALGQAKESAGNLTGSGFGNILGTTVNKSLTEENALIAQMLDAERSRILQAIMGFGTAGVAPPTTGYQPGFLDMLMQSVGQAAPMIAGFAGGNPAPMLNTAGASPTGYNMPNTGYSISGGSLPWAPWSPSTSPQPRYSAPSNAFPSWYPGG